MDDLAEFRSRRDDFFRRHQESPLTPEQRRRFRALRYYPENPAFRLRLPLDAGVARDVLEMDTSTGEKQTRVRAGKITFEVDGAVAELYLYSGDDPHQLFLPFRDATSAKESYGAGRYLDVQLNHDGTVEVDFNYAYNPYCAYNDAWSCPIPPSENWLKVAITAGEMAYDLGATEI